ncbi:MAG TPA: M28 family peptidase [Candidatus Udaeobacter sp.]|nr:M28 family peptidase [Candidatus Udaeobacter sp.]
MRARRVLAAWKLCLALLGGPMLGGLGALPAAATPPRFDGGRALVITHELCDFGPRVPGTKAHAAARDFLAGRLAKLCDQSGREDFVGGPPSYPQGTALSNLVGRFRPGVQPRVLLSAHWDSRPHADADPDSTRRRQPVLGANDAASACAVLLHLAELLHQSPPPVGVDLVFFDGEDGGIPSQPETYCLGSAEHVRRLGTSLPAYVINLDMVGGRNLLLPIEGYSQARAPEIVELVWGRAEVLGHDQFVREAGTAVFDDHLPFLRAGIPAIDVIDFSYPEWHTTYDTPDRLSAASLQAVGEVMVSVIYEP